MRGKWRLVTGLLLPREVEERPSGYCRSTVAPARSPLRGWRVGKGPLETADVWNQIARPGFAIVPGPSIAHGGRTNNSNPDFAQSPNWHVKTDQRAQLFERTQCSQKTLKEVTSCPSEVLCKVEGPLSLTWMSQYEVKGTSSSLWLHPFPFPVDVLRKRQVYETNRRLFG
jgi:hypothetical protein